MESYSHHLHTLRVQRELERCCPHPHFRATYQRRRWSKNHRHETADQAYQIVREIVLTTAPDAAIFRDETWPGWSANNV